MHFIIIKKIIKKKCYVCIKLKVMQIEFDVLKNYKEKFICITEANKD